MNHKIVCLLLLLVMLFPMTYIQAKDTNTVRIVVGWNKSNIRLNQHLLLTVVFENNSNKKYAFNINNINSHKLYGRFFQGNKNYMYFRKKPGEYLTKTIPLREDFFIVEPHTRRKFTYNFKVERGIRFLSDWVFFGNFLNYNDDIYVCMGFNKSASFNIEYKINQREIEIGEKIYGVKNLYKDAMRSNTIKFEIE